MIISLARMPPDGLEFKRQYEAGELDTREYDFKLEEPPLVGGRAIRAGQDGCVEKSRPVSPPPATGV